MTEKQIARFWAKVKILGPEDCWEWQASKDQDNYGLVRIDGSCLKAHRVSWQLTYGLIPKGLFCCHHCDNPSCINPGHLFLGTNQDNMTDMSLKGRSTKGQCFIRGCEHGRHKLTEEQVLEIRKLHSLESHLSQAKLAVMFGVAATTINDIVSHRKWKHI
jgi:hypothetical protein